MIVISRHVVISDGEFEIIAIRTQGADGQHINKASTAIHLRFNIQASSLPEYYKECLPAASHHLINSDEVIVIKVQEYRSQELNRKAVLVRLATMVKDLTAEQKARRPTQSTHTSEKYRLASKTQKSSMKTMCGKVRSGQE